MKNYRYILEPYKGMNTRYTCPSCNNRKVFTLYIDTKTGEHLPEQYGICSRQSKCNYHLNPYKDGYSTMIFEKERGEFKGNWTPAKPQPKPQRPAMTISFIPVDLFKASLKNYEANNFIKYLIDLFNVDIASQLIGKYFIGTSKHWDGATVFWQIDSQGKVRTGKIMLYSPTTGKRIKEPFKHINWVHNIINKPEFELRQCLFGEHLLIDKIKPVAIVESEKTAIIASVYLPQFIWIACGSLTNLNADKCKVLKGRKITLYPDLNGYDKWKAKAQEFSHLTNFTVSDLLERKATEVERQQGLDLADYLIKFDYKQFIEPEHEAPAVELLGQNEGVKVLSKTDTGKDFDNMILAFVKIGEKKYYNFLFNCDGEGLPEITNNIMRLGKHLCNTFKIALVQGEKFIVSDAKPPLIQKQIQVKPLVPEKYSYQFTITDKPKPIDWEPEIKELEKYFTGSQLPKQPLRLNQCSIIKNIPLFIETHFATIKENNGNKTFLPFLNRLQDFKQHCKQQ